MSRCGGWPGAPATVKMWDPDADGHGGCNGEGILMYSKWWPREVR